MFFFSVVLFVFFAFLSWKQSEVYVEYIDIRQLHSFRVDACNKNAHNTIKTRLNHLKVYTVQSNNICSYWKYFENLVCAIKFISDDIISLVPFDKNKRFFFSLSSFRLVFSCFISSLFQIDTQQLQDSFRCTIWPLIYLFVWNRATKKKFFFLIIVVGVCFWNVWTTTTKLRQRIWNCFLFIVIINVVVPIVCETINK